MEPSEIPESPSLLPQSLWPLATATSSFVWTGNSTRRIRSSSATSSGPSSRETPASSVSPCLPRPLLSPSVSLESEADQWSGMEFNAGSGVDYNLLADFDDLSLTKKEEPISKLDAFINYLDASNARLVMVDKTMWLENLKSVRQRYQMLLEKDISLCVFCRNNNEPRSMYLNHKVRDRNGRVTCPVLRRYECPLCHVSGDEAHTLKYCPLATSVSSGASCFKTTHNACGRKRQF